LTRRNKKGKKRAVLDDDDEEDDYPVKTPGAVVITPTPQPSAAAATTKTRDKFEIDDERKHQLLNKDTSNMTAEDQARHIAELEAALKNQGSSTTKGGGETDGA